MRDKPLKDLLNKSLSQEAPGFSAPLVTFDVLDDKICLFTVLDEGQSLETALILDELAVQHSNLVHLCLHVPLPLGEFDVEMPVEGIHDQFLQGFACLHLLAVLLVCNDSLLAFDYTQQLSIPGVPLPVRDTFLLFQDLQGTEIDPSDEGLLEYPLVPKDYLMLHVIFLEVPRELCVPSPLIEVLVKDLALKVGEVFDSLGLQVPQTLPLLLEGVQLAELSSRDLLLEKLLVHPLEFLLLLVVPECVEADLGYVFGPPQPGFLVRESLVSPHLLSKHDLGLE